MTPITSNKNNRNKTRNIEFDILKLFAIILVLWGHAIMHLTGPDYRSDGVFTLIYSFHMPLFMMVSGFFAHSSLQLPFKELVTKKFWQLIYPCISFGILFFLVELIFFNLSPSKISSYLIECFWFLKSCFLSYLILYLCLKLTRNSQVWGALLAIIISQAVPVFKITWMLPFFTIGFLLYNNFGFIKRNALIITLASLPLFCIVYWFYVSQPSVDLNALKSQILNGNVAFMQEYFNYQIIRIVVGFAGSATVFCGILCLSKYFVKSSFWNKISVLGRQTLGIYILQTLILESVLPKTIDLTSFNSYVLNYLFVPLISLVVLLVSVWILNLIKRSHRLQKLLWGK